MTDGSGTARLTRLADNIWSSRCLLGMGLVSLSRRMTIVRLPDGSLWLHSPNDLSRELLDEVAALGPVRWLVAPNRVHHRALREWKNACPEAGMLGVPGLAEKMPGIPFDGILDGDPPEGWGGALEMLHTEGAPKLSEIAFFHVPSRTLILTDFVFNQGPDSGLPALSRVLLKGMKAYGGLGPSRIFRFVVEDTAAVGRSIRAMLDRWPVERVSMSHGEILEEDAAERLREAYVDW